MITAHTAALEDEYRENCEAAAREAEELRKGVKLSVLYVLGLPIFSLLFMMVLFAGDSEPVDGVVFLTHFATTLAAVGMSTYVMRLENRIAGIVGFVCAMLVVGVFVDMIVSAREEVSDSMGLLEMVLAQVLVIGGVCVYAFSKSSEFAQACADGKLRELDLAEAGPLRDPIDDLRARMGVTKNVRLWYSKARSISPSVFEDADSVHLVLPSGLMVHASQHPSHAHAMIAHEFGHVLQRDTDLWLTNTIFANLFYMAMLPVLAFSMGAKFIIALLSFVGGLGLSQAGTGVVLFNLLRLQRARAKEALLRSEQLADQAAVIFSDPRALYEVVKLHADAPTNSATEYSPYGIGRAARIERLQRDIAEIRAGTRTADGVLALDVEDMAGESNEIQPPVVGAALPGEFVGPIRVCPAPRCRAENEARSFKCRKCDASLSGTMPFVRQ